MSKTGDGLQVNQLSNLPPLTDLPSGTPEVWCRIGLTYYVALLDTGCTKSMIRKSLVEKLKSEYILEKDSTKYVIRCANNTKSETDGRILLDIKLGQMMFQQWFILFSDMPYDIMLGLDFFRDNSLKMSWTSEGKLEFSSSQKLLAVNSVDSSSKMDVTEIESTCDNGVYPLGNIMALHKTVIPPGVKTAHEFGIILEEGLKGGVLQMDILGEFLNKGITAQIRTREFKSYPPSTEVAFITMIDFDSAACQRYTVEKDTTIGVVQFRDPDIKVTQSYPLNEDQDLLAHMDEDELFGAFPEWYATDHEMRSRTGNNATSAIELDPTDEKKLETLLG